MKKILSFRNRAYFRLSAGLFVVAALSALAIIYVLPRESQQGYEYEINRPWKYATLIAEYDFPVYRTPDEVKAEQDSALHTFRPFFNAVGMVAEKQIKQLRDDHRAGRIVGVPAGVISYLEGQLTEVYRAGVLSPTDFASLTSVGAPGIRVLEGREAAPRDLGQIFSTRSAYEHIMLADTVRFPREVLMKCNLNNYLTPNLLIDTAKTNAARNDLLAAATEACGMVQSGQRIIDKGEIVNEAQFKILQSLALESERRGDTQQAVWSILGGQVVYVVVALVLFLFYLRLFRRDYVHSARCTLLLFTLMTLFAVIPSLMVSYGFFSVYLVPFAMVAIFVRVFLDSRTAFVAHMVTVLLASLPLNTSYQFLGVQMVGGMVAIYGLRELTERSQLLRVALMVTLVMMLFGLGFDLAQGTPIDMLDTSWYVYVAINGVLLLFTYPLMYLVEKVFGFTSSVSLVELTNINNPILRHMSKYAQGTFVHSMQVANLAAEVAHQIGAKTQLVRTGALYHDIGKLAEPYNFTENQSGQNSHKDRTEEESAQIILNHVKEGLRMADKYHLPSVIKDFIRTHHGRSRVKYFYIQWVNKHPGEPVPEELFTYPGPNPGTREQAVLMMCDAVEAAARSLKEYTEESIQELVNRIVDTQVAEGYFRECPLTFRDISVAKRVLGESLKTMYHTRIAYPEIGGDKKAETETETHGSFFHTGLQHTWKRH